MVNEHAKKAKAWLRQVPWSFVVRAAVFAVVWLFLPFWSFVLIATGMYFFPLFQPFLLFAPFLLTVVFASLLGKSFLGAIFLGVLFYLTLGIKDLVFIDRRRAYRVLALLIFLALFLNFFYRYPRPDAPLAVFGLGLVFFLVFRGFILYIVPEFGNEHRTTLVSVLAALLVSQIAMALLILPLSFFYQAALLFMVVVLLVEFLIERLEGRLERRVILTNLSIILIFFPVVLALNHWSLY